MPNQRIIAVWGSPHSGKTVFATKFAECLYRESRGTVIVLYTDILTPSLPVLFPNRKSPELYSVGTVLSKTDIYANDVVSNLITVKECMNFGYLGYRNGENPFSFPDYSDAKAENLLTVLCELADYVVVVCMSNPENSILSATAMKQAGMISEVTAHISRQHPQVRVRNVHHAELSFRDNTLRHQHRGLRLIEAHTGKIRRVYLDHQIQTVPYSPALREQYLEGNLTMPTKDWKYMQAVMNVVKAVRA